VSLGQQDGEVWKQGKELAALVGYTVHA
jgi:hypothetical protein